VEFVEKFCTTRPFSFGVVGLAFIFHALAVDLYGILIFGLLASLAFLFFKDGRPGITLATCAIYIVSKKNSPGYMYEDSPNYYFQPHVLIPIICIACLMIGTMIFRCIKNRSNYKTGKMYIPLIVLSVGIILSGIGRAYYLESLAFGGLMALSYVGIYLLFMGCLNEFDGMFDFMATLLTAVAFLVAMQVALLYVEHIAKGGDFDGYWKGSILVGWGISNNAGAVLALALPFTLFKVERTKNFLPYLLISLFALAMLAFTLSRTSILFGLPVYAILYVKALIKSPQRSRIFLTTIIVVSTGIILLMALTAFTDLSSAFSYFEGLFNKNKRPGLSGRDKLWKQAWQFFLDSKIFGEGFARSFHEPLLSNENSLFQSLFHNFIFQVFGSGGIVGVISMIIFIIYAVKVFISKHSGRLTVIGFCIVFVGTALFDIVYLLPYCIMYVMLAMVTVEKINQKRTTKEENKVKNNK
jgi:O-antigen ligase